MIYNRVLSISNSYLHLRRVQVPNCNIIIGRLRNILLDHATSCKVNWFRMALISNKEEIKLSEILPWIIFQDNVLLGCDGSSIHSVRLSLPASLDKHKYKRGKQNRFPSKKEETYLKDMIWHPLCYYH